MNTNEIGARSEAIALAAFVRAGYSVLTPFGVQRYDFVIEREGTFVRIQCKTGRLRLGKVVFHAYSLKRKSRGGYDGKSTYSDNEIDAFAVYCPETDEVYLVPIEDITSTTPFLRIDPPRNGQSQDIKWASDYRV